MQHVGKKLLFLHVVYMSVLENILYKLYHLIILKMTKKCCKMLINCVGLF